MSSVFNSFKNMFNDKGKTKSSQRTRHFKEPHHSKKYHSSKTPTSSNLTTVSTLVNSTPKYKNEKRNNKIISDDKLNDQKNSHNHTRNSDLSKCLSVLSIDRYTSDTISSLGISKDLLESNYNNNSRNSQLLTNIKSKLQSDYEILIKRNKKLLHEHETSKDINEFLRNRLLELEQLNQRLLSDNAEILQEAIKHRFLKLESEDLTRKTSEYKHRLEEKENIIVKFQRQYENLKIKNNIAFKQREEALLEASHACQKLKELSKDCAELDIYKSENVQRRHYFNELQTLMGNIRVYLRVKPTNRRSCLSFVADDKILIGNADVSRPDSTKCNRDTICRFTKVFQPSVGNVDIFEEIEPLLLTIVDGFNCSFITYGQTHSGKSNTFFGDECGEETGIISEALRFFVRVTEESTNWNYSIYLSAVLINRNTVFDVFKKGFVEVLDDGTNLIMKCTEEFHVKSAAQCSGLLKTIKSMKDSYRPRPMLKRSYCNLLVILRLVGDCRMNEEQTTGLAMFCEATDFDDDMSLMLADRDHLREEKIANENLMELGRILKKFKNSRPEKSISMQPESMLIKLLYPCFDSTSKCCLLIHCFSDEEQHCSILKTIQFGLMAMPYSREKKIEERGGKLRKGSRMFMRINSNSSVQWEFHDN